MGREVRRVALDFDWPIGKVWHGFVNHHRSSCATCGGDGMTSHGRYLRQIAHMISMGGSYPDGHPFMRFAHSGPMAPGPRWAELSGGLAGREPRPPFGHDGIDDYSIGLALLTAAGLPKEWGWCPACDGEGEVRSPEAEGWQRTNPPAGDGWQVWETTSEGSPISAVCSTPEALARWCVDHDVSTFGRETTTYERWLEFIRQGWAPSMVAECGVVMSGVDAAPEVSDGR